MDDHHIDFSSRAGHCRGVSAKMRLPASWIAWPRGRCPCDGHGSWPPRSRRPPRSHRSRRSPCRRCRTRRRALSPSGGTCPSAAGPRVEVVCAGGSLDACPLGSRLLFVASAGARPGYVAAYAEPAGGGGERVWYFSSDRDAPAIPAASAAAAPLDSAVQIGPEHRVGRYLVHVVVGARPLSRDEALHPAAGDALLSQETIPLEVVR